MIDFIKVPLLVVLVIAALPVQLLGFIIGFVAATFKRGYDSYQAAVDWMTT